jgi:hypothetical protein
MLACFLLAWGTPRFPAPAETAVPLPLPSSPSPGIRISVYITRKEDDRFVHTTVKGMWLTCAVYGGLPWDAGSLPSTVSLLVEDHRQSLYGHLYYYGHRQSPMSNIQWSVACCGSRVAHPIINTYSEICRDATIRRKQPFYISVIIINWGSPEGTTRIVPVARVVPKWVLRKA